MNVHFIEGLAGCRYAVEHDCAAVVVDALRASATAAMFLHAGAASLTITEHVEEARRFKVDHPEALLFGERGGVPPEGFEGGNSPRETHRTTGRDVVFTTTTGAGRLVACWGAPAVYMGTTINAAAAVKAACAHGKDVVIIPAGLTGDDAFDAVEDRAAGAWLVRLTGWPLGEGAKEAEAWIDSIDAEGLPALFDRAPHAEKLRRVDQTEDIAWCAQVDVTDRVPQAVDRNGYGVVVAHGGA